MGELVNQNMLNLLLLKAADFGEREALVWNNHPYSYHRLLQEISEWKGKLTARGCKAGEVIGLRGTFSLPAVAALLALFDNGNIVVLIPPDGDLPQLLAAGQVRRMLDLTEERNEWQDGPGGSHPLLEQLSREGKPGFVLFSSGSSGTPKAILHELNRFLGKFRGAEKSLKTLAFLMFDHVAGLDTLFYTLFSGGSLVIPKSRDPESICQLVEEHKVQVLPASPTFFRLLLMSQAYVGHDLSSLRYLTYGSEPMSQGILNRLVELFPAIRIVQKYGMSEFGSPPSRSRSDGNLWMKLGSEEFRIKVVDNILWVKAVSTMLGYLNAPPPEIVDGWMCTGDQVEVDNDWVRILGRHSEMINVGGEKVYPAEVEAVIEQLAEVKDVVVFGEAHPFLGSSVSARVQVVRKADIAVLKKEIRQHCRKNLPAYKVPLKIAVTDQDVVSPRQKKKRHMKQSNQDSGQDIEQK